MQLDPELRGYQGFPPPPSNFELHFPLFIILFAYTDGLLYAAREDGCQQGRLMLRPSIAIPAQRASMASTYKFPEKDCDGQGKPCVCLQSRLRLKGNLVPERVRSSLYLHTQINTDGVYYQKIDAEEFGWAITVH